VADGGPYSWLGTLGNLVYLAAVAVFRIRG
jgi:hypothetical protein